MRWKSTPLPLATRLRDPLRGSVVSAKDDALNVGQRTTSPQTVRHLFRDRFVLALLPRLAPATVVALLELLRHPNLPTRQGHLRAPIITRGAIAQAYPPRPRPRPATRLAVRHAT